MNPRRERSYRRVGCSTLILLACALSSCEIATQPCSFGIQGTICTLPSEADLVAAGEWSVTIRTTVREEGTAREGSDRCSYESTRCVERRCTLSDAGIANAAEAIAACEDMLSSSLAVVAAHSRTGETSLAPLLAGTTLDYRSIVRPGALR